MNAGQALFIMIGLFCIAPLVIFGAGYWLGRSGYRVDVVSGRRRAAPAERTPAQSMGYAQPDGRDIQRQPVPNLLED